jgi:peptide/nickel transport system permease protein
MPTEGNADASSDDLDWRSVASEEEVSSRDRAAEFYRHSIKEPAVVAWADSRTRLEIGLLSVYLLVALVDASPVGPAVPP